MSMTNPQELPIGDENCVCCEADLELSANPTFAPDADSALFHGWCATCAPDRDAAAYGTCERKPHKNDGRTIRAMNHHGAILDVWGRLFHLFPGLQCHRGKLDYARRTGVVRGIIDSRECYACLRTTYGPTNKQEWLRLAEVCLTAIQQRR